MLKKYLKKLDKSLLLFLKIILYVLLLGTFFLIMSYKNRPLMIVSRTMGSTLLTFIIVGMLFLKIYGTYDIGRRKSKPIIYSLFLAIVFTDIVTYLELMIMNTIIPNIHAFRFTSLEWLLITMLVQLLIIILFVYGGNAFYFYLHEPESCCVIIASKVGLKRVLRGVMKYKKQYKINYVVNYKSKKVFEALKKVNTVFICDIPVLERTEIINYCYEYRKNVYFTPEISDIVEANSENYLLDDISVFNYNVKTLTLEQRLVKRSMDLLLAVLFGVISFPVWVISAFMIKSHDHGKVLFKQKRATLNGRVFEVYKFRTMKENVENRSVTKEDDRITPPGKILRKTRLDELPQLLNILKGDMSFVGPRPEMLENVNAYTEELPEFKYRLRVKAGLTGYAQIAGKYNTSPKDKLMMDLLYIEKYSIWKDIQLLFQTAIVLLKSDSTEAFELETESELEGLLIFGDDEE
ncbi:sugar transferase [Blautia marasmi]|uniref:sugar transferase n=1 Tax=Blautia marasmi TaxID=1917868 RepID=UPI001FA82AA6|nr:sugar transferase [Blautia marasmi]